MDLPVMRRVIHTTRYDDGKPGDDEGNPYIMSWRDRCKYQQKESDGASLQDEVAYPDFPMTKKPAK
jgi:hypothetical protein